MKKYVTRNAVIIGPATSSFRSAPFHTSFCENMQVWTRMA